MSKKVVAVIIVETVLLLAAAGIFLLSDVYGIDVAGMLVPSPSPSPAETFDPDSFFSTPAPTDTPDSTGPEGAPARPQITAHVSIEGNLVTVKEQLLLPQETTRFHGYMFVGHFSDYRIRSLSVGSYLEGYTAEQLNLYVELGAPTREIEIEYSFNLKYDNRITSITDSAVQLTHFLMTPAVLQNGAAAPVYLSSVGDPYIYEVYDYAVEVSADASYDVFAIGELETEREGGRLTAKFHAPMMRDFPLVLARGAEVTTERTPTGVLVTYVGAYECAPFVNYAMEFADANIGPYPYDEFIVVKNVMSTNSGMEFSGMIFMNANDFKNIENLKNLTYHEVFHQWFYGLIGTDQLAEPFLDEGLVTYLAAYLRNGSYASGYSTDFVGRTLADYSSRSHYNLLAYTSAGAYIAERHAEMGDDAFFDMLRQIYRDKAFQILYYSDFLSYLPQ